MASGVAAWLLTPSDHRKLRGFSAVKSDGMPHFAARYAAIDCRATAPL
jgi:hypothetical protein